MKKPGAPAGLRRYSLNRVREALFGRAWSAVAVRATEALRVCGKLSERSLLSERAHAAPCLVDDALRDELLLDLLGARVADAQLRL